MSGCAPPCISLKKKIIILDFSALFCLEIALYRTELGQGRGIPQQCCFLPSYLML